MPTADDSTTDDVTLDDFEVVSDRDGVRNQVLALVAQEAARLSIKQKGFNHVGAEAVLEQGILTVEHFTDHMVDAYGDYTTRFEVKTMDGHVIIFGCSTPVFEILDRAL